MKNLNTWLTEYAESHQNPTNKRVHYICVPLIFWSIYFLMYSIPFPENKTAYLNVANIVYAFALIFWFRLDFKIGLLFFIHGFLLATSVQLFKSFGFEEYIASASLLVFSIAWVGQFYGHKIEGKKPSFFKDLQFLLIGPVWILYDLFLKKKLS